MFFVFLVIIIFILFLEQVFLPVTEKNIYSGNIEHIPTKEKSKFPQEFFPEVII